MLRSGVAVAGLALVWLAAWYLLAPGLIDLPPFGVAAVLVLGFAAAALPLVHRLGARRPTDGRPPETPGCGSAERLAAVLRHVPVVLWTVDRDLRFTSSGGSGLDAFGLREDELVGRRLQDFFGTEDTSFLPLALHVGALEGRPGAAEVPWGERVWQARTEPLHDEEGEVVGAVGVALDVTEWRDAERSLESQRAHLRQLFDESPEAIVLVDPDDRVLDVNREFERLFGYTRQESVGRRIEDLVVPAGRGEEAEKLTRQVAAGERIELETVRRRKDGTALDVSLLATPVNVDGERTVYGIYRDITVRRALETQLLHSQRLEAVGQLAGGIAHDFNNILTAILGHARVLRAELTDEAWIQEDLLEIEQSAERAAELTRQLLTFSRRDMVSLQPVDLDDAIRGTRRMLQRLVGDHVELVTELAGDLPPVLADAGQIQQIILNLVLNARDAMPDGGTVVVRTRRAPPRPGEDLGAIELEVEDEGRGMDPEERARVFEPFFTTKPQGRGTGLGMSTVYGIVDAAGGSIEVDSAPGRGTTVRIRLPVTTGQPVPLPALAAPADEGDGQGARVLLVDDDEAVLKVTRRILERAGFQVITAGSGRDALDLLGSLERPPDVLLTDIVMPRMGGVDLARRARAEWPAMDVLFMTGYAEALAGPDNVDAGGPMEILQKPFDAATLVHHLRRALARDQPSRPPPA